MRLVASLLAGVAQAAAQPVAPSGAAGEPPPVGQVHDAALLDELPTGESPFALIETLQPSIISDRFASGGLYPGQLGMRLAF